jgi:hypothetical protein
MVDWNYIHFQKQNSMNYMQWAAETIQQGPTPLNLESPIKSWDDFTLAMQHQYHVDQIRRCQFNLQTLEIWPEYRSELFNETLISADIDFHGDELAAINAEIQRRMIP